MSALDRSLQVFLYRNREASVINGCRLAPNSTALCRMRRLGERVFNTFQVWPEHRGVKPY